MKITPWNMGLGQLIWAMARSSGPWPGYQVGSAMAARGSQKMRKMRKMRKNLCFTTKKCEKMVAGMRKMRKQTLNRSWPARPLTDEAESQAQMLFFRICRMPGTIFSHFFIAKQRCFRIFLIFRTFWKPWTAISTPLEGKNQY